MVDLEDVALVLDEIRLKDDHYQPVIRSQFAFLSKDVAGSNDGTSSSKPVRESEVLLRYLEGFCRFPNVKKLQLTINPTAEAPWRLTTWCSSNTTQLEDAKRDAQDKQAFLRVLTTTLTIHPMLRSLSLALSLSRTMVAEALALPGHEVLRVFAHRFPKLITLSLASFPLHGLCATDVQRLRDALPSLRYLQLPPAGTAGR
eukprot:gene10157-7244_t